MKTYARIESGIVVEIIGPAVWDVDVKGENGDIIYHSGDEIDINERFTPQFVETLVEITNESPQPEGYWVYNNGIFSPPVVKVPTPQEILIENTNVRDLLLAKATLAIAPLQDAVDLEDATESDVALLKKWKQYRVAVNRVDLTLLTPKWPTEPS